MSPEGLVPSPLILTISANVVSTAMTMPAMPKLLPRRAVAGCERPFKAWMKQIDAIRYSRVTRFMLMLVLPTWPWALSS